MKLGIHGLPLRSAVIARRRRRVRLAMACLAFGIFGFVGAVAREIWPQRAEVVATIASAISTQAPAPVQPAANETPTRPVYKHSVVPGGAYSRREVADAMRRDAVVAAHYQSIDVERVRPTTVAVARSVYVSYRKDDKVYWTKRPVRLAPGETLLSDGTSEIRARCGNLVSDHAMQPVAAEEPAAALLDETESGASSIADARTDGSGLTHVPFMQAMGEPLTGTPGHDGPAATGGFGSMGATPMWSGFGGGLGASHDEDDSQFGNNGHVSPLGGSGRGSNGGGEFLPPGGSGDPETTTGGGQSTTGGGTGTTGETSGGTTGTTTGTTTGDTTGFSTTGNTTGTTTGQTTGTTTGDTTGSTTGDTTGSTTGETTGFTTGETTGTTTGETTTGTTSGGTTTGIAIDTTNGTVPTDTDGEVPSVPEPATLMLFGLGACGAAVRAWRARR